MATTIRRGSGALAFISLALASSAAMAQQSPALDRVSLWVGGYYANADTTIAANDSNHIVKGKVNLEDDLGFREHKTVPRVRADFLLGDHQGISVDYYNLNRSSGTELSRSISYGGNTYNAAARVRGRLNFSFGSVAYRWWFGEQNDVFGVGLGGAYYKVKAGISGEASLNGQTVSASSDAQANEWAPVLQLGWRHAFNDQWRMYVNASGVKKNGGALHGHIYDAAVGLEWFPWQNLGFGAEYGYTRIKLEQNKRYYDDSLDMKFNGPSLFVRFRF